MAPQRRKKGQKWAQKNDKNGQNPFFLKKSDFFLLYSLIICENACLRFSNFFNRIKKVTFFVCFLAKFYKKYSCTLEVQLYFLLILLKSVENEKVSFSQMIKLCQRKKSLFLRKNGQKSIFS